jgi:vacuolar protein 8
MTTLESEEIHQEDSIDAASRTFSQLLSDLLQSVAHVNSLPLNRPNTESKTFNQFAAFVSKFSPILVHLEQNESTHTAPVRMAVESLEQDINYVANLIENSSSETAVGQIEEVTHNLGRCLGIVLSASLEISPKIKDMISALHQEMIDAKFDFDDSYDNGEGEIEITELNQVEGGTVDRIFTDIDDVTLQLKNGNDEALHIALSELSELVREKSVPDGWLNDRGIVSILLNRLGSSKHDNRLMIILILRRLASEK